MATTSSRSRMLNSLKKLLGLKHQEGREETCNDFEQTRTSEGAHESIDRGISSVPLEKITGSVGRYHDFDAQFKPKGHNSDERLQAITRAMKKGRLMPPIMLYQIKDSYYILDGHHRFAAAKELGYSHIRAAIVELLPSKDTVENKLYRERSEFRDRFKLPQLFEVTELGQFEHLVEQIQEHRRYLEIQSGNTVPESEAAADWYSTIYQPLKALIDKSGLVKSFDGRTVDDLYLYISVHQWKYGKSRQYGIGVDKLIPKNMEEFRENMAQHSEQEYPEMRREINAFILINVEGRQEDKIIEKLYELEAVREVHSVNGSVDIIIRVKLMRDLLSSDAELISQFMATTVRQWNGVVSTQTLLPGLSLVKDR